MKHLFISLFILSTMIGKAQTLETYFEIGAKNNPGIQAKYRDFEAALLKFPQVTQLPDPSFSLTAIGRMVETRVGPQQARFTLSQMFPWFGTLKMQGEVATLMAETKYQSFLDMRNKLYYQISLAYYPLHELEQLIRIEQENINLLESYKTITNFKFQNGSGSMVDVLRVDIMLSDAKTSFKILNEKQRPLLTNFNKLLNRPEDEAVPITESLTIKSEDLSYWKDSLFVKNPSIDELDLKIKTSRANELLAEKQGYPKLGFGLDYIIVGERTDLAAGIAPPIDNGKDAFMLMLTASIPLFRGKYDAAVKEAQVMQGVYAYQKEELKNTLTSSYEMTTFELFQQKEMYELFDEQTKETQQILNLLYSSYSNSGKDFDELLRVQQQLLKYQKMQAMTLTQYHNALAKLYYITSKTF
ncbi:MAG: TolC family protein [Saprospiraceae bacterium]